MDDVVLQCALRGFAVSHEVTGMGVSSNKSEAMVVGGVFASGRDVQVSESVVLE